jgi:predicted O-methyltransferase YrrM
MMGLFNLARRLTGGRDEAVKLLRQLVAAETNQADFLNRKFDELLAGIANHSDLVNRQAKQLSGEIAGVFSAHSKAMVEGLDNQSQMVSEALKVLEEGLNNQSRLLDQAFKALIKGSDNQSQMLDEATRASLAGSRNQSQMFDRLRREIVEGLNNQSQLLERGFRSMIEHQSPASSDTLQGPPNGGDGNDRSAFNRAMRRLPLMIDGKTYNTSHPDYDARLVRNHPGQIFNADLPCKNAAYVQLKRLARGDTVPDQAWTSILQEALAEAKTVPGAEQVFERRAYIETYLADISRETGAHYAAGWVNLDDALFLYWLVRQLRPRTIVQTGVCNGLSSAFMMLGLAKNGADGTLSVIDLPPIFDPGDATWRIPGKVYGVVIPEGKTTGWIVPDIYRDRFEVQNGDAKALLPKLVDRVKSIDFFYHDSDHTYDHMMFEFRQAKRKLAPGGLIVGDDISWNASVWDFADEHEVPSYNFKGAVGVAFF